MAQYDWFAEEYRRSQEGFYGGNPGESRSVLYSMLDFPLGGKRLLDLGCGFGTDLDYFQSKGAVVHGVDESIRLLELARNAYPKLLNLSVQDFEKLSFADRSFDIVVSRFALQHSPDLVRVFREIHRILDVGGVLVYLVGHPVMQYLLKKKSSYWESERVTVPLFGGKVAVQEPTHIFSEYFSGLVLRKFDLLSFVEGPRFEKNEVGLGASVPDYFVVKMKKREF